MLKDFNNVKAKFHRVETVQSMLKFSQNNAQSLMDWRMLKFLGKCVNGALEDPNELRL